MKPRTIAFSALTAIAAMSLAACVHIDDDSTSDQDEIRMNTERAVEVCGEGKVAEVSEEGFTCKN